MTPAATPASATLRSAPALSSSSSPTTHRWPLGGLARAALVAVLLASCGEVSDPPANASADELMAWGLGRLEAGDPVRATAAFRRVLLQDSLRVEAMAGLARSYELQGKAGPADTYRSRAFAALYERGLERIASGQADSARVALEAARRIIPRHPLVHLRLGELHLEADRVDSAIAQFQEAVAGNPRYAESLVALGRACARAGRDAEARQAFERAVQANVNALPAYIGLGEIFVRQREWAQAAAQFEKALLIDANSEEARRGLDQARGRL